MTHLPYLFAALLGALLTLGPRVAAADPVRPWQLEVDLRVRGNSDIVIVDGRIYAGASLSPSREKASWLPFFGAGACASYGSSSVDDARGLDGTVSGNRYAVGLELRGGFAGKSGGMHHYVYLGLAPLYVGSSSLSENLPEVGGAFGMRSSLGFGYPGKWPGIFGSTSDMCKGGGPACGLAIFFLILLPNHVEFNYENVAGSSHRFGGTIGYSF